VTLRALVVVFGIVLGPAGAAEAAPWTAAGEGGAGINWSQGIVMAKGVGPADRHTPSPAVARVASRRAAEVQARGKLLKAVKAMKLAGGGTVGDAIDKDKDAKARLEAEIERAVVTESDLITDGSSRVTMVVGIEAVRQALSGVRTVSGEDQSAVWIVEARSAKPAIGWKVKVGGATWEGPMIWTHERADVVGTAAVTAKASSATGGVLTVSGPSAPSGPPPAGALVIVVVPEK
jgi:hypothetical protein